MRATTGWLQTPDCEGEPESRAVLEALDFSSSAAYEKSADALPYGGDTAMNVKRVKVKEFETYTAYRVWFDTVPGVQAYGILGSGGLDCEPTCTFAGIGPNSLGK